jgi:hypothetical protein
MGIMVFPAGAEDFEKHEADSAVWPGSGRARWDRINGGY